MKKLVFIFAIFITSLGIAQIPDAFQQKMMKDFQLRKKKYELRNPSLFSLFNMKLPENERKYLVFLYAYMPLNDLADYPATFHRLQVQYALKARETFRWGKQIPEDIFRHFVLPYRINNENLDTARIVFFNELKDRIKNMSMKEAVLEVNHWCHEKVAYHPTDARTISPLNACKTAYGRCGEESTFTTTALRAVGIPARQCYTPRWAHCDDNHAWVEVWVDGKWYFLGACEPESDLNLAWFSEPAKRTMLVNSTVIGPYNGAEEVLESRPLYTRVNMISNYAPTKKLFAKVMDKDGKPLSNISVEYQLYNYAEFYPLARKTTDKNGLTSLTTGYGDLVVWASNGKFLGFEKVTVANTDTVQLRLVYTNPENISFNWEIVPPVKRAVDVNVSAEAHAVNEKRLKYEDSLRAAYEATFADSVSVREWCVINNMRYRDVWPIMADARGNWKSLLHFLENTPVSMQKLAVEMLKIMEVKDLHDVEIETLSDHLANSNNPLKLDENTFMSYILNPRVESEKLTPYKHYLQQNIPQALANQALSNPSALVSWIKERILNEPEENYSRCPLTPFGVMNSKTADERSRNIFFVSACRALGIAARLEPATKRPQYYFQNQWMDAGFESIPQSATPLATIYLSADAGLKIKPEYSIHYTLEKLSGGYYRTLDYEMDERFKNLPFSLPSDTGYYLMITGNRMPDGTVLAKLNFFRLNVGETHKLTISLAKRNSNATQIGKIEKLPVFKDFKTRKVLHNSTLYGKQLIYIWIDPDKEPTKHALGDLSKLKTEFEKTGLTVLLIFDEKRLIEGFQPEKFAALPSNVKFVTSDPAYLTDLEQKTGKKFTSLPVFLITDTENNILFLENGYKIGVGEQMLKEVEKE